MKELLCGAAKVKITPPAELLPKLYGLQLTHFAGVIDDIHVRVLIIGNGQTKAMFASWELDKAPTPEESIPAIAAHTGIDPDHILYFSVHTHTAPLHSARPFDGPNAKAKQSEALQNYTTQYEQFLYSALEQAADQALASMKPCRIGWNVGECYVGESRVQDYYVEGSDGNVTRITSLGSNPKKDVDRTLFVMRVEDLEGNPVAFMINHAVHCCVMILNNFDGNGGIGLSSDIAGQVSSLLEEKYPGSVALWSSGAAGNVNPVMLNQYNIADPADGSPFEFRGYKSAEPAELMLMMISRRQFADVLRVNRTITCDIGNADISGGNATAQTPARNIIMKGPGVPPEITPADESEPYEVFLHGIRIGNLAFCGASGELFDTLGAAMKNTISSEDGILNAVVINHDRSANAPTGYIFDDETMELCTRADGTLDGLPSINHTRMIPGYIKEALTSSSLKLFRCNLH